MASSLSSSMSPHSVHSPKVPCCIRSKAWGEVFQHLPGGCRLVDERLPFILARRLIRWVGMFDRTFLRLMLGDGERMVQFRNTGFENPLELLVLVR
jgi:hypothetical protein